MHQLPSPPVVATVRHDHPPLRPPAGLVPFVEVVEHAGAIVDWEMTSDAVAFGEPALFEQYVAWRAAWERVWVLDPLISVVRLIAAAAEFDSSSGSRRLGELAGAGTGIATGAARVVEPDGLGPLQAALQTVSDAVRDRGALGFGVVDATEGVRRVGLVAAWAPGPTPELLAADEWMRVELDAGGMRVCPAGHPALDAVSEVAITGERVRIAAATGTAELALDRTVPLGWLVPGAARWRVRQVPEVLVWARTLAGIEAAARYAVPRGLPVRFATLRR